MAGAQQRKAVIRTSDRALFKRCRRKWGWQSGLRQNRRAKDSPSYFWLGTGGHFALEDYHGYNHFGHPVKAFDAYVEACRRLYNKVQHGLPADWKDQSELGRGILEYYPHWLSQRGHHETVWIDGAPQVEIRCEIPLPVDPPPGFDVVVYQLTLDRLVEINGEYWITDYKFYKSFSTSLLEFDQQMSAYIWGAQTVFDKPIAGAILHEFKKDVPNEPRILSNGKLSHADRQGTTHRLYRDAIIQMYGDVDKAPRPNILRLNTLAAKETEDRDDFIRRSYTRRTEMHQQAEGTKILMEAVDMCNPDLPLYPNPTRDCSWDCGLQDVCLMVDRDDDWQYILDETTITDEEDTDQWRDHLQLPQ